MLRGLVLLFLLVNAGLFYWLTSDPHALQPDREPQRLARQMNPDAIQVLPDLPGGSGKDGATAPLADGAATPSAGNAVGDSSLSSASDGLATSPATSGTARAKRPADKSSQGGRTN
jgi:hypothetical protein